MGTEAPEWLAMALAVVWQWVSSPKLWVGLLIPTVGFLALFLWLRRRPHSVSVGLPFGIGSMSYNTTPSDRVVAWKLYVQLTTRKAALPFDEDHDLIHEVYDSLHNLFAITRELLVGLPVHEFGREEGLASLMLRVLNDGVRPHLTRWQGSFRSWWEHADASNRNRDKPPQELQRDYPQYAELVADLKQTNTELSKFADELLAIARNPRRKRPKVKKVSPIAPTPDEPKEARHK